MDCSVGSWRVGREKLMCFNYYRHHSGHTAKLSLLFMVDHKNTLSIDYTMKITKTHVFSSFVSRLLQRISSSSMWYLTCWSLVLLLIFKLLRVKLADIHFRQKWHRRRKAFEKRDAWLAFFLTLIYEFILDQRYRLKLEFYEKWETFVE